MTKTKYDCSATLQSHRGGTPHHPMHVIIRAAEEKEKKKGKKKNEIKRANEPTIPTRARPPRLIYPAGQFISLCSIVITLCL